MANKKDTAVELELYLVRHGYSMTNAGQPVHTAEENFDPFLTETGKKQAELLGRRFAALPLDCVISSGLRRAAATAAEVVKSQPENGAHKLEIHPAFSEWGITDEYPGKTMDEIRREFPMAVAAEGAENFEHMIVYSSDADGNIMKKTAQALNYLRRRFKNGEKVMLVGHGKFNGFLLYSALGLSENHPVTLSLFNTGVTKLVFFKNGMGIEKDVSLVYFNDHSHLLADYPTYSFDNI